MLPGVIGRLEKTVIDCSDPRALAQFYRQLRGMKVNEDIDGGWLSAPSPACGSWRSSGSMNGCRRAGQILHIRSSCTSIFASVTPTKLR
jgi:hypothetical protein